MSYQVPADTVFSGAKDTAFPNWNNPSPGSYAWTLPDHSHFWNVGQNISQGVFSFVANSLLQLLAWIMHIGILVSTKFSDPTWLTNGIVAQMSKVFKAGYKDIFVKFLPVLIMIFVGWLAWKYVVAHHAKMITGVISVLLASGLVAFFFADFGQAFGWIDSAGQLVTNTAASAVASTVGTNVGSEYDVLWNNYVVYPWEYGQFGGVSGKLSDFNINPAVCNVANYCTFTNDSGNKQSLSGNWVTLFLQNTSATARKSLESALNGAATQNPPVDPFVSGSPLNANNVVNADPYGMIAFLIIELLLIIAPVVFLIYVGFQLFVRELLFIVTILAGIVTVPMAFVPEIGWGITLNWIREAVGHQVERLGNAVYAALLFAVSAIITTTIGTNEMGMMLSFLVETILFSAAMIYRQKVFSLVVHPMSDAARGVDTHQQMTADEYIARKYKEEQGRGRRSLRDEGHGHKLGHLAEHFSASESEHDEHFSQPLQSGRRLGHTAATHAQAEQKPVYGKTGHISDNFKDSGSKQRIARGLGEVGQVISGKIQAHIASVSNPEPPLSREERVRNRELSARGIEAKLHGHAIKTLHRGITALTSRKLRDGFDNPSDDKPDAPPPAPPVDENGNDKLRKVMVTPDGHMSQNVITDKEGQEIAVEPPVVARPQRNDVSTESSQSTLDDGFRTPTQDVPETNVSPSLSASVQPVNRPLGGDNADVEQARLSDSFATEAPSEPEQTQLSSENALSHNDENDTSSEALGGTVEALTPQNSTDSHIDRQNATEEHFGANRAGSETLIEPVQTTTTVQPQPVPRPLPSNVTRLETAREPRPEVEGRQRPRRERPKPRSQGRVVRVNERRQRTPRPRGPEL